MHLGNGAVTVECATVTWIAAAAGLSTAAMVVRRTGVTSRQVAVAGALGAAVFAAQAVNVPVLPFASAHLVGGVLLAALLGPALGAVTMGIVLAVQALALGDGGMMALGANVINMALLPTAAVWAVRRFSADRAAWRLWNYGGAALLATVLASVLIALQVAIWRTPEQLAGWTGFAMDMVWIHALIAVGEAALTVGVIGLFRGVGRLEQLDRSRIVALWAAAVVLAVVVMPFASSMPDGYEASAERSDMAGLLAESPEQIAAVTGSVNAQVGQWQQALVEAVEAILPSEVLAVGLLTVLTGLTCWLAAGLVTRRAPVQEAVG